MSEEVKKKVLEALKSEAKGAAALTISRRVGLPLMDTLRILEEMVREGIVERRGKAYRLIRA
ncbi:MAG: helix-turn-helix domain-containing protein [Candidatus Nezhaarchaeota archaeon]|nr:helix-turn-helix domain-containing protein [Candidatus Nezhaarchaeota archaeon]